MDERWECAVSVATVWTDPANIRNLDVPALEHPAKINEWLQSMTLTDRKALSEEQRIQTQLLYGEPVLVDDVAGDWAKVVAIWQPSSKDPRGYPGWVPLVQLQTSENRSSQAMIRVTSRTAWLHNEDGTPFLEVSFNTILPPVRKSGEWLSLQTAHGCKTIHSGHVEQATDSGSFIRRPAEAAFDYGTAFLGLPYLWGGMSAFGFDCSGFVYNLWKACGHRLPRDASDQAQFGTEVAVDRPSLWEIGDLLFFSNRGSTIVRHVGMYAGDGQMLHAPSTGKAIEFTALADYLANNELRAVRRVSGL